LLLKVNKYFNYFKVFENTKTPREQQLKKWLNLETKLYFYCVKNRKY
jgi:hypothetical protein